MIRALLIAALAATGLAGAAQAQDPENVLVIDVAGEADGTVEIELLPEVAPAHVERIKALARDGAYDGVAFHRVIDGFMAQTGDVAFGKAEAYGTGQAGTGGSEMSDLPAEFSDVSFDAGVVGMARSQDPDSANSQFFIMFAPAPHLDGQYTVVGRVIAGQDVIDAIKRGAGPNGMVADAPDVMERVQVKADM
jgi:peptidylprolyl isomerase